jgi:type IV pilus assembly protein PilO
MATIAEQRKRLRVAAILMGVVCLLALLYLLAPVTASSAQKQQQLLSKQAELRAAQQQTKPLQQLPQLVAKSRADISSFYAQRLPAFPSTVYDSLYDVARKNNVRISEVKYDVFDTTVPSLGLLQIDAKVSGPYPSIVRFINSLERNKLFFLIDGLTLSEGRDTAGGIQLTVRLETYLRPRTDKDRASSASLRQSDDGESEE